jgi:NTE family protein
VNYRLVMIKPWSWDRHSLNLMLEGGGSSSQETVPLFVQDLGGLFRMSGFQHYQLSGRYSLFGGLRYIYRVADNDFGAFKAPLFLGAPSSKGGLGQGRGHQHRILLYLRFPLYGGGEFPRSHLPRLWRGGGGNDMFYLQLGTTFQ